MEERTAVVIGASGLIGSHVLNILLEDDYYNHIRILVRKELPFIHQKLEQRIVNFDDVYDFKNQLGKGDVIFCCIGTTQKRVKGDNVAYEKIDHDIPVNAAQIGYSSGFKKFVIVSSVGANENSSNFYLRLKGKTETDIKKIPFEYIGIFRPSMLLGKRNEVRRFETILQGSLKLISGFLFGSLQKYHSINAHDVAKAMVAESKKEKSGIQFYEYKEMMKIIR